MMEQPAATTVQEFCNLARKEMTIRDVCRNEDYPEDSFNKLGETVSHNLISALSKLTTAQEHIEKQLNEVRSELSDQRKMIHKMATEPHSSALNRIVKTLVGIAVKPSNNCIKEIMQIVKGLEMAQIRTIRLALLKEMDMGNKDTTKEEVYSVGEKDWTAEKWGIRKPRFRSIQKYAVPPTNVPVSSTDLWNAIEPKFPSKPELSSNTTEHPIPSEPDVSSNPTATSDSYTATTEHHVFPTSRTTQDAAGAHPRP